MELEQGFHDEMMRIYEEAKVFNYCPTYFLQMVNEMGGVAAAKRLLEGEHISDGLTRLWEEGRLDISMEALILREPWRTLFTEEEVKKAETRLKELGYDLAEARTQQ